MTSVIEGRSRKIPELLYVDETTREGQNRISTASKEICAFIDQFVRRIENQYLGQYADIIPVVWGTYARKLFSPKSDFDFYIITPDERLSDVKKILEIIRKETKEIRFTYIFTELGKREYMKRLLPRDLLESKFKLDPHALSRSKIERNLTNGMWTCITKAYQTPQQILISASYALRNQSEHSRLIQMLVNGYRSLAEEHNVGFEKLFAGLYSYNLIAHLYFGLRNPTEKGLPRLPSSITDIEEQFRNARFSRRSVHPECKSLAFREWQYSEGAIDRNECIKMQTKVLYRCACDFLPTLNVLTKGDISYLTKDTFQLFDDRNLFEDEERNICYKIVNWRLAKLEILRSPHEVWKLAKSLAQIAIRKIEDRTMTWANQ